MKKNLFEMGADFGDGWSSDNKDKPDKKVTTVIKPPEKHQLYVLKEKRSAKEVTIIRPFYLDKATLRALLKTLKKKLGTGGTVKDDSLEFQGDIPELLRKHLEASGYRFKT